MAPLRWSPRGAIVLAVLLVALLAGPARAGPPPTPTGDPAYIPPVEAPIVDPFRPPPTPYGPGNRGIEYATVPGTPVRAAGAGEVSFAGSVAGSLYVTISHPDGIRTSYSFLADVTVRRGEAVDQGTVVGHTGSRFHVGARRGDIYIDPASLWGRRGPPRVALVPLDGGGTTAGQLSGP